MQKSFKIQAAGSGDTHFKCFSAEAKNTLVFVVFQDENELSLNSYETLSLFSLTCSNTGRDGIASA